MFCGHCGIQGEGRFCTNCGRPMDELASASVEEPLQSAERTSMPEVAGYAMQGGPMISPAAAPVATSALMPSMAAAAPVAMAPAPVEATNVTVNVAGPQLVYQDQTGPGLLVRGLWFVFIGWWLGGFWIGLAAFFNLTIIGLPLGIMMFNAVPKVMTLKSRNMRMQLGANADGSYSLTRTHLEQRAFWQRALYFVLVGCWFSVVWAYAAWAIGLLIITLPISFWMFDRIPALTTLARY